MFTMSMLMGVAVADWFPFTPQCFQRQCAIYGLLACSLVWPSIKLAVSFHLILSARTQLPAPPRSTSHPIFELLQNSIAASLRWRPPPTTPNPSGQACPKWGCLRGSSSPPSWIPTAHSTNESQKILQGSASSGCMFGGWERESQKTEPHALHCSRTSCSDPDSRILPVNGLPP